MHLWQIDENRVSLEAHVLLEDGAAPVATLRAAKRVLAESWGIGHSTLEVETLTENCGEIGRP